MDRRVQLVDLGQLCGGLGKDALTYSSDMLQVCPQRVITAEQTRGS